jgi:WD40 repeat protein
MDTEFCAWENIASVCEVSELNTLGRISKITRLAAIRTAKNRDITLPGGNGVIFQAPGIELSPANVLIGHNCFFKINGCDYKYKKFYDEYFYTQEGYIIQDCNFAGFFNFLDCAEKKPKVFSWGLNSPDFFHSNENISQQTVTVFNGYFYFIIYNEIENYHLLAAVPFEHHFSSHRKMLYKKLINQRITCLIINQDYLITADNYNYICILNNKSKDLVLLKQIIFPVDSIKISCIALTPDNSKLIIGTQSPDGIVYVYDLKNLRIEREFAAHPGGVLSLVVSPYGDVASSGKDRRLKIWKNYFELSRSICINDYGPKFTNTGLDNKPATENKLDLKLVLGKNGNCVLVNDCYPRKTLVTCWYF